MHWAPFREERYISEEEKQGRHTESLKIRSLNSMRGSWSDLQNTVNVEYWADGCFQLLLPSATKLESKRLPIYVQYP